MSAVQTILSLLDISSKHLQEQGIEDPRLNAELLLCHVLRCKRIDLYLQFERILTGEEIEEFRDCIRRRLRREPVQYITGETEFMGLRFAVDPRVLIPRPETELLVEEVVGFAKREKPDSMTVLDIGTGSGNIAVSLVKMISGCRVVSIDASASALEVAAGNVDYHECRDRVELRQVDFLMDASAIDGTYDCIVSNPPYIPAPEEKDLQPEVRIYEPRTAWSDGNDGLTFYHTIAREGKRLLRTGGRVFLEIGFGQSARVSDILRNDGYQSPEIIRDYAGIERIIKAQR